MSAEAQWLSDITFFNLLDEDERAVLSKQVEAQRFPAGTVIFKAGDSGNAMYVIRTGSVEISLIDEDKERVVVAVFSDGDFFGELSLLDEEPRSSTATALKDTDVVLIDREDLRLLFTQKPHAALDMLATIGKRLRENDKLISSRAARNANEVIDEELTFGQRLADKIASFGGSWPFIIIFLSMLTVWIIFNSLLNKPFDPFPFILLNLFLSMIASLQAPVIMMSQNRANANDRIRAELDYNVNLKAELEIAQLHQKLDGVREELLEAIGVILQHDAHSS
jgi:CRP/FNR family transcriptional regulator, cyclic AMP receptor protein